VLFGFGDDEIDRLLDYLYPALANEIQQPKRSCKDETDLQYYIHTYRVRSDSMRTPMCFFFTFTPEKY